MYLSGLEPHTDDVVLIDVRAALMREPDLASSEIDASCDRGVVTLRGTASSREASALAERVAFEVRGVLDVVNRLEARAEATPEPNTAPDTNEPPPALQ